MKIFFALLFVFFSSLPTMAQHLWYNDTGAVGDILISDVMVDSTAPTTYYETLGWNQGIDGGGYTGIQDSPTLGKIFIHSLWNASTGGSISNVYAETDALVEPFGGEGEGMHILTRPNYKPPQKGASCTRPETGSSWSLNNWYTILTRAWPYKDKTYYGLWVKDNSAGTWRHIVTWAFPQISQGFKCCTMAFLENWSGGNQGMKRKMNTRNIWKHYSSGLWSTLNQGTFDQNTRGGVINNAFFMETGPQSPPNITSANQTQSISTPGSKPNITPGEITSAYINYSSSTNSITASWTIDAKKGPQFSFLIEIFDNSSFTGTPLITSKDTIPHIRSNIINVSSLPTKKTYYVRFSITDVIDQKSKYGTSNFYKGN